MAHRTFSPIGHTHDQIKVTKDTGNRTNNTTFTVDEYLQGFVVEPNTLYALEGMFFWDCVDATPDIKFKFVYSATPVAGNLLWITVNTGGVLDTVDVTSEEAEFLSDGSSANRGTSIKGYFKTHATDKGTVELQWAQQTSDASAARLFTGSWVRITKLANA